MVGSLMALGPHSSHLILRHRLGSRTAPAYQGKRATCRGSSRSQTTPAAMGRRWDVDEIAKSLGLRHCRSYKHICTYTLYKNM